MTNSTHDPEAGNSVPRGDDPVEPIADIPADGETREHGPRASESLGATGIAGVAPDARRDPYGTEVREMHPLSVDAHEGMVDGTTNDGDVIAIYMGTDQIGLMSPLLHPARIIAERLEVQAQICAGLREADLLDIANVFERLGIGLVEPKDLKHPKFMPKLGESKEEKKKARKAFVAYLRGLEELNGRMRLVHADLTGDLSVSTPVADEEISDTEERRLVGLRAKLVAFEAASSLFFADAEGDKAPLSETAEDIIIKGAGLFKPGYRWGKTAIRKQVDIQCKEFKGRVRVEVSGVRCQLVVEAPSDTNV